MAVNGFAETGFTDVVVDQVDDCNRYEDYGDECDASESGYESFVDFPLVDFVKQIATVGNQKDLRYQYSGEECTKYECY